MMSRDDPVVVAGGGAMGSSLAFHLLSDPTFRGRVLVVEKDPTYRLAASALSAASIRQQYSQALNVRLSLRGIEFLRRAAEHLAVEGEAPAIGLHEGGYLYLAGDEHGASVLRTNHAVQTAAGAEIDLLDPGALAATFPWLNADDLALGAFGRGGEGWFDGWALLQGLRRKARALGADYVTDEVVGVERRGARAAAVRLRTSGRIACAALVNCAGSGGPALAALAGVAIPVQAKRRSVFTFTCPTPLPRAPLLVDTSGVWMRPEGLPGREGQLFIAGWSPPAADDPDWSDYDPTSQEVDWAIFDEVIWPALARRVPALATLRPGRAWAGPYDMNLVDHNAIIGPDGAGSNVYLCNGFSGHGLQHAAAVGRGLAELVAHGAYRALDLSALGIERIKAGRPFVESNVI